MMKEVTLKRVGLEAEALVQEILDAAPTYTRNTDGIDRDPNGGRDTLMALGRAIGVADLILAMNESRSGSRGTDR